MKKSEAQTLATQAVVAMMAYNAVTDRKNWWDIVSWWEMPYGKVPKGMWIGHAENPDDKLYWENPRPPDDPSEILNWGKPKGEQYWTRAEDPVFWTKKYIDRMAIDKFSSGKTEKERIKNADYYFYKNPMNLTNEQWEHQEREWERRLNGIWIMINGEATYLTGKYYTYLQHWYLEDCYPDFRDRDLLSWYAWQNICDDPLCYGGIFPKHRRAADTTKWAYEGVEETTRTKSGHFGIQAAGKNGAKKVFTDKVVKGWKRWPLFFKPVTSTGDNPKTEIIMDAESRKGRSQHSVNSAANEEALEGWIKYEGNGGKGDAPFDGDKMVRYFRDEGGKEVLTDIIDTWELVRPCLINRSGRGKAAWPSTVEDVTGKHRGAFERLYRDSMPSLLKVTGTGQTKSGLKSFFLPCYIGHAEWWFTGKFGESIIHAPTPEQRAWLLERWGDTPAKRKMLNEIYDKGGAYEFELGERTTNGNSATYKRKFPFHIGEVFAPTNPNCRFNLDHITSMLDQLAGSDERGQSIVKKLTVQGRLEWVGKKFLSDVVFVEDSRGPFLWNRNYLFGNERANKLGMKPNNVLRDRNGVYNGEGSVIKIGFDPQKQDAEDATGNKSLLSHAAGHAYYPYDPTVDPPIDYANPSNNLGMLTAAWIFEYFNLPMTSKPTWEDMVKACIFLNAKFHSEKQVFSAVQFFKLCGASRLLLRDATLNGYNKLSGNIVAGQAASKDTELMANDRIAENIDYHPDIERNPFARTLTQCAEYDGTNSNRLDLKVSKGFTLMAAQPRDLSQAERAEAIGLGENKPFKDMDSYTASMCRLY